MTIDEKIDFLRAITSNFLFIEYYPHTNTQMWKILNEHTKFKQDKVVLCPVIDGIEKALDVAIKELSEKKRLFELGW